MNIIYFHKIGDVQLRLGNADAALTAYHVSLAILQQLVKQVPQNAQFRRHLAISFWNLYDLFNKLNLSKEALVMIKKAQGQFLFIQKKGILAEADLPFIETSRKIIARLKGG